MYKARVSFIRIQQFERVKVETTMSFLLRKMGSFLPLQFENWVRKIVGFRKIYERVTWMGTTGKCVIEFSSSGNLFFLISKKKILLIKARETQKVHGSEQWKKETTRQKQPLIYSNRRNKIRKGRTIRETPTTRPIKEGLLAKL